MQPVLRMLAKKICNHYIRPALTDAAQDGPQDRMEVELMLNTEAVAFESRAAVEDAPLYLRADVKLEPLLCGWYAWSHMLSPVQAAMNLAFRYLPLLESFVANPHTHVAANSDPKLFGGPFVNLQPTDIPQVKELLA